MLTKPGATGAPAPAVLRSGAWGSSFFVVVVEKRERERASIDLGEIVWEKI